MITGPAPDARSCQSMLMQKGSVLVIVTVSSQIEAGAAYMNKSWLAMLHTLQVGRSVLPSGIVADLT